MRGFTLKIPFLLPGFTVLNFVQIHIFCVASAQTSTFLQKSLLCWHLSHTLLWKTELCSWTKVMLEVQQRFKTCTNKLPSLQPGSGISQNSMFTWTHPSKADRGQPQPGSHTILLAQHYLQIKFSLSNRTICWDTAQGLQLHCIFLSLSATKTLQKSSVTHHGGNLRGEDILSCDLKGVLQTKQSTHNPWPFRTASERWFPQAQIMYHL